MFEEELSAAHDDFDDASRFWLALPEIEAPVLPVGAHSVASAVSAPPALGRSLAFAGWVESESDGRCLQPYLAPGQRLVDRDGRLWRWDGFTCRAPGTSAAAQHLRHKNRLEILGHEILAADTEARLAEAAAATAAAAREAAAEADRLARLRLREAEAALAAARTAAAELAGRALAIETRLNGAAETVAKLAADLAEARTQGDEIDRDLTGLPETESAAATLAAAREAATQARREEADARATIDQLRREAQSRGERLGSIDLEERAWRKRAESAATQRETLDQRRRELEQEIAALAGRPAVIAADSETLGAEVADGGAQRRRGNRSAGIGGKPAARGNPTLAARRSGSGGGARMPRASGGASRRRAGGGGRDWRARSPSVSGRSLRNCRSSPASTKASARPRLSQAPNGSTA